MAFFEWEDRFSVNVATIDKQHRRVIDLTNQLHDAIQRSNDLATKEAVMSEIATVKSVLESLTAYAQDHFATEEAYLLEHAYPELEQHQAAHRQYTERVSAYQRSFERPKERLSLELAEFLAKWWRGHILERDQRYAAFLSEKGVA